MKLSRLLLFCSLTLVGCKIEKKASNTRHEGPKYTTDAQTPTPLLGPSSDPYYRYASDPTVKVDDSLREILEPLSQELLNSNNLADIRFTSSDRARLRLTVFNKYFLQTLGRNDTSIQFNNIKTLYISLFRAGCQENTWKNCKNLEFFKLDWQSSQIAREIARQQKNTEEFLLWIHLSFEFANNQVDLSREDLFLSRALEMFNSLTATSREETQQLSQHLTIILQQRDSEKLPASFVSQLPDWLKLIKSGKVAQRLGGTTEALIMKSVVYRMRDPKIWSQLSESFLHGTDKLDLNSLPEGYFTTLRWLEKFSPGLLKKMDVTPLDLKTLEQNPEHLVYFFIAESIFDLKSMNQVGHFWNSSEKRPVEFLNILENVYRVYFLSHLVFVNTQLSAHFKLELSEGSPRNKIIERTRDWANNSLAPHWKNYVTRINNAKAFFDQQIKGSNLSSVDANVLSRLQLFENFLNELPSNIETLSVYPNMFMLGYYAYIWDYDEKIPLPWGGNIHFEKKSLANELLLGRMSSLFQFVDNKTPTRPHDSFRALWSIYFLVQSDLFKHYGVTPNQWVQVFYKDYFDTILTKARKFIDNYNNFEYSNGPFDNLYKICQGQSNAIHMELGELKDGFAFGFFPSNRISLYHEASQIIAKSNTHHPQATTLTEAYEIVRSDIDDHLLKLKFLKKVIGDSAADSNTSAIDQLIQSASSVRNDLLQRTDRLLEKVSTCFIQVMHIEHKRRQFVFKAELDHSKLAAQYISRLNELGDQALKLTGAQRANFPQIAELAQIADSETIYTGLSRLLAEKSGLAKVFLLNPEYRINYLQYAGIQRDASGLFYYSYRDMDTLMRVAGSILQQYGNNSPDKANTQINVPRTLRALRTNLFSYEKPIPSGIPLYRTDENQFVFEFLDHSLSHLDFFNPYAHLTKFARHMLMHQVSAYKTLFDRSLDLADYQSCDLDCQTRKHTLMRKKLDSLIQTALHFLDFFNLNNKTDEQEWLKLYRVNFLGQVPDYTGNRSFLSSDTLGPEFLFVDGSVGNKNRYLGIGDEIFALISSIHLGAAPSFHDIRYEAFNVIWLGSGPSGGGAMGDASGNGGDINIADLLTRPLLYEDAKPYSESVLKANERLVFAIPIETLELMKGLHTRLITNDFLMAQAVFDEFRERPTPPGPVIFSIGTDLPAMKPFWLSQDLKSNYLTELKEFNRQTQNAFLPELLKSRPEWQ